MLFGKGMFIWMIRFTEDGDVNKIADLLEEANITNAWIKVADGPGRYNIDPLGHDRVPALVAALRMRGISAWGWQYIYGRYPELEADMAIRRIREFDLDGFVVNAELEFKQPGMAEQAKRYMKRLRAAFPDLPIGLSTYRFPVLHREFVFDAFMPYCDFCAPQVYWAGATNAGAQLERCLKEYKNLNYKLPIYPTGAAYKEHGWEAKASEMVDFMATAKRLGLPGFNFWEMRSSRIYIPGGWEAIKQFAFGSGQVTPKPPQPPETGTTAGKGKIGTVLTQNVNVRTGPGVRFSDVGDLVRGESVPILDIGGADAWAKIQDYPERWVAIETGGVRYLGVSDADPE
jgi:hypothetical protein